MISLTFLPLEKLAGEHYRQLKTDTLARFNRIHLYFETIAKLQSTIPFPEADIRAALIPFNSSEQKLLMPDKTHFYDAALHSDHLSILKILKPNFKVTLKGKPAEQENLVSLVNGIFLKYVKPGEKFGYHDNFKPFIDALKYVWDYSGFIVQQPNPVRYDAYKLAKKLDVRTCPYCNRSFTLTVIIDDTRGKTVKDNKIIRPEFDHFYLKSRYPYLGTSFYNLVPSCSICNSTLKGETPMSVTEHCHPYLEGYEDVYSFNTGVSVKDFLKYSKPKVPVKLIVNSKADFKHIGRATATHLIFEIANIYPHHAEIAEELFRKSTEDSKKLILSFWNQQSSKGNYLFNTRSDVYRHFIGNYFDTKDFYKRPLAKFQYDILKETMIIKYIDDLPDRPAPGSAVPLYPV